MFGHLEQILVGFASQVPLELFSPFASLVEEVIPPIPSPAVMIVTGSIALIQNYTPRDLIILVFLGALGKACGASITYFVCSKVEDIFSNKISKFFGITLEQIEAFGTRLGHGPLDYLILFVLRALPIIPSTVISVGCGLLKIQYRLFLISTFLGSLVRDFIYIYLGFVGTTAAFSFLENTTTIESIIEAISVTAVVLFLGYLYLRRQKAKKRSKE